VIGDREGGPDPVTDQGDRNPGQIRPYAMTGGRTRPARADLAIEALVSVTALGRRVAGDRLGLEWRPIALLCEELVSVAEISARLEIPLGVARVLVADMVEVGLVVVHQREPAGPGGVADPVLLERVLGGLRALCGPRRRGARARDHLAA
jgi:hypothetical protein